MSKRVLWGVFGLMLLLNSNAYSEVVVCDQVVKSLGKGYETQTDKFAILRTTPVIDGWTSLENIKGWQVVSAPFLPLTQCVPESVKREGLQFTVWPVVKQRTSSEQKWVIVTGNIWLKTKLPEDLSEMAKKYPIKIRSPLSSPGSAVFQLNEGAKIETVLEDLNLSPLIQYAIPSVIKNRYRLR